MSSSAAVNTSDIRSPILSAVFAWYAAATKWDFDALADLFDNAYYHKTIPAIADDGIKNKVQALAYARSVSEALGNCPMKYEIYDHIESDDRVWTHSRVYAEKDGKVLFNNESIFLFSLTDGETPRIKVIREFVDTKMKAEWKSKAI